MFKIIIDAFLGGTMEKMLKSNSGLTAINTILLLGLCWLSYENFQQNNERDKKIDHIQAALYYNHIRTMPEKEMPSPSSDNSSTKLPRPDVVLADSRLGTEKQKNN